MGAVEALPYGEPLTRDDLDAMPEDGHRYELIDGVLIVSPAPLWMHQRVSGRLYRLLCDACPADLEVLYAPFDVVLAANTVMQPDLLVTRLADYARRGLEKAPLHAVEILSDSTRAIDLTLKPYRLAKAGCASYWVVDPDEPSLMAWDLRDGAYVEVAKVIGDEAFRATRPFEVCVVPGELIL